MKSRPLYMKVWQELTAEKAMIFLSGPRQSCKSLDFLLGNENQPFLLVETKLSETRPSPALLKFQAFLDVPAIQLTNMTGGYRKLSKGGRQILVVPAWQWLSAIP